MKTTTTDDGTVPAATHLIATHYPDDGERGAYAADHGECCFCGVLAEGVSVDDAVNHTYFSNYDLMAADTGHVCSACAYCMDQKPLKQGHWVATDSMHERVSTGDLREWFGRLRAGDLDTPLAVHVSENPIRSEHAYLWTPVVETTAPLVLSYADQRVELAWREYDDLVAAIEELRWHGFRGDDIRSGEPRIADLESVGADRYRTLDAVIDPHRTTPLFEVCWTVSRSRDDQPSTPDHDFTNVDD